MKKVIAAGLALAAIGTTPAFAGGVFDPSVEISAAPNRVSETQREGVIVSYSMDLPGAETDEVYVEDIVLELDDDFRIRTEGLPRCKAADIYNRPKSFADQKCGPAAGPGNNALVGEGTALIPNGGQGIPMDVTLYNGIPEDGSPTLLINWTFGSAFNTYGKIGNSTAADLGPRVRMEAAGMGFLHISELDLVIGRSYRDNGVQQSYVSARCGDSNRLWNFWTKVNRRVEPDSAVITDAQLCERR